MDHQSSRAYSIFSRLISDEIAIMAILGIIVGLAGGFGAIGFRYLIDFCQSTSYGSAGELLDVISSVSLILHNLCDLFLSISVSSSINDLIPKTL